MLDFAHRSSLQLGDVDIAAFLEQLVPLLRRTLPEDIRLNLRHDGRPYWVRADRTRLQQIFMNLVSNAGHAIRGAGQVTITLLRHGVDADADSPLDNPLRRSSVGIDVDTGEGMTAAVRARAFEAFFTTKPPAQGTGLGLAQVHGLVDQHDGHVELSSVAGEGTTVTIWLPAPEPPGGLQVLLTEIPKGRGERVLVVDADPAVRDAMAAALNWLAYSPTPADSGEAAISILAGDSGPIAAIVSDARLPDVAGGTLAEVIEDRWPDIPVILVSGFPPTPHQLLAVRARRAGEPVWQPVTWIHKPFSSRTLAVALRAALHRP